MWDPGRVPEPLRGKFVGSVTGSNCENLTVVLADGSRQVVHRDLVKEFDVAAQHGPRRKHVFTGAIIGAVLPAGEAWKAVPLENVEWSPDAENKK